MAKPPLESTNFIMPGTLAGRYAFAIYDLSKSHNLTEEIANNFQLVIELLPHLPLQIFAQQNDLSDFIKKMSELLNLHTLFSNFLQLLVKNHRFNLLNQIYKYFKMYIDYQEQTVRVDVQYYDQNTIKQAELVVNQLFGNSTVISYHHNPLLLGGIIINTSDGVQIDASLLSNLNNFQSFLMKG